MGVAFSAVSQLGQSYTVDDWLCLHCLDKDLVCAFLSKIVMSDQAPLTIVDAKLETFITPDMAFEFVVCALSKHLPIFGEEIYRLHDICKVNFSANPVDAPYATPRGDGTIEVSMCYVGSAADLLCVAHELGHALQLSLTGDRFVPPVYRELAAFAAEAIFLRYIEVERPDLSDALQAAWGNDSQIYLQDDARELLEALQASDISSYIYRQNYPLARAVAETMRNNVDANKTAPIFQGNIEAIKTLISSKLWGA